MKKHLTLTLEKKDFRQMKADALTFIILISVLSITTLILLSFNLLIAGFITFVGTMAYVLALTFNVEIIVERKTKKNDWVRNASKTVFILLLAFILFTIIQSAISMKGVVESSSVSQKFYGLISLGILASSLIVWNGLQRYVKNNLKKSKYFLLLIPITLGFLLGQAQITGAVTLNDTQNALSTIDQVSSFIGSLSNMTSFVMEQQNAFTQSLGLSDTQSMILMGVIFLVALLLAAKFIESIIKWLVLILIGIFIVMLI